MIKGILKGYARRAYGCLPSTMLGYDPNKAKELLDKAGVKPGTVLTYYYADPYGPIGSILQAQLGQIGITLKLQKLDEAPYQTVLYSNGDPNKRPNMMAWGWWPDFNDPYDECNILL